MNVHSPNPAAAQGWIKAVDPKSARTYYANTVTRKTQWDVPLGWVEADCPPLLPPEDNDEEEELPPGWEVMHDPTTGKPFYVDHKRKITQWTRPKAEKKFSLAFSDTPGGSLTSSAAMGRVWQGPTPSNNVMQPRSYFQEAAYFQPAHSGTVGGDVDLSDSMPALDFAVKKVADKYRLECPHCGSLFTLSKRRHHCRLCGDIFCDACSSHRVSLPLQGAEFEKPVRICDFCNNDVEQGNFFSMRRYLTPLILHDPLSPDSDEESGVATNANVNAALAALTLDLDQILQNAEGFEEKITIPPNILVANIIKHMSLRSETYERAVRALASLLSLGSMVGNSDYAHAVYFYGKKKALDQVLAILERSGTDRRTLFVQEKAAQVTFYVTESQVVSSVQGKRDAVRSDEELGDADSLDIQRCLRSMIDHSSSATNPNLQRWATATVRNLVVEDQRRACLAINEVAAKIASGESASTPAYESFLGQMVSTGGIMILCSLIGADDSDTRAHVTGALGAILTATRAIDCAMSALAEMTGGAVGQIQGKDGEIIRAITAGSSFGSSVSQLLLSADDSVAGMGCHFVASLVLPILTDPEGSASLPGRYECRNDPEGLGACREAALEIAGGACLPALISLVKENGRRIRPLELRCTAMETLAATATAIGEMGKAWADGKYEEGMEINYAPASLTRAVAALNEEKAIEVALEVLRSSSVQSLGSQRDTPAARIREAAGIILGAITTCSAEAIMELHSRQVLSNLILSANDSTMTAPSSLRGDSAPRCLGMLEAAASILMFSWQHPAGAESELLDRLIEALDIGAITYLFRALTFKMDWESRDKSAGAMKARAAACRLACCLFGIALTDETSIGMRRLMDSCDADQASRRETKGPRNLMEAVLTALQASLTHAHRQLAGGGARNVHYHSALLDLVEAALLATGSMCGSSMAPGGSEGTLITGDQFIVVRADEFESRRKELCKVACDVVIRGGQSGPALLPTMMVGGFGEGAVGASLRLALSIAQNGSKDQHSKLAYSGILVPVSDILKAALSSGDIYRFSAALALVRFCGPHVASGTNGGMQSVRDAIRVATNVLTLPIDPGASKEQIEVQESLKAECVRSIESLSKNPALWSAISNDALPSIIGYLDNCMGQGSRLASRPDTRAAALRAVLEIVQVPSHGLFAAECGLAGSLGKLIGGCHGPSLENIETISLSLQILRLLVSRQESRRHCDLFRSETLRSLCFAVGRSVGTLNPAGSEVATLGIEIIQCAIAELNTRGNTADILHSSEARFLVDSIASETSFLRALCATILQHTTGMELGCEGGSGNALKIPSVYGRPLSGSTGPCAGFGSFEEACASVLFTTAVYASAIDSAKSEIWWNSFLAQDQLEIMAKKECRRAAATLAALFLSLISEAYSGFQPHDGARVSEYQDLLYPLINYRLLEALKDILKNCLVSDSKDIDDVVLRAVVSFNIPRICLSSWQEPALLELSYELLSMLVEAEPEVTQLAFVESKASVISLFKLLTMETLSQTSVNSVDIRRFLTATLEKLAVSGALTEAVEKYDIKSSAIGMLAAACLAEEESSAEDEDEVLTSNRLSNGLMQCLVDLCKTKEMNIVYGGLQVKASEAVVIAEKLGKKICRMVISRFLERAKMQQYEIHDHEDVMTAPDVAMLCAIVQHEEALHVVRSIGGLHALAQVAGEGAISAIVAIRKGCKDDPELLLEADIYLSILGLFSPDRVTDEGARSQVECAAFNILADLCTGSHKGRLAVTAASSFKDAFDRALKLASPLAINAPSTDSDDIAGIADENRECPEREISNKIHADSLVEAAYYFLSATTLARSMQESLACNDSFVKACFMSASTGSTTTIRKAAMGVVAKLCLCQVENSSFTPDKAAELFRQVLNDHKESQGHESRGRSVEIVAAEGLLHILDKLKGEQEQLAVETVVRVYLSVVRQRSLSKSSQTPSDRRNAGELAFSLVRILVLGMRSKNADKFFGSCAISPLVGTVQWRYDAKTTLDCDEKIYWEATTCYAMEILSLWFEQGKSCVTEEGSTGGFQRGLKGHVWMVASPGKAPRKSIDFEGALQAACKNGEASTRLAAGKLWTWLSESGR